MHTANDELVAATAGLTHPFASTPDPGHAVRVAPGVMWLRMPLPFTGLNHINLCASDVTALADKLVTHYGFQVWGATWTAFYCPLGDGLDIEVNYRR